MPPRRRELLIRRQRDTREALAQLQAGELWHPMTESQWQGHLLATLDEIVAELGDDSSDLE